MKYIDEFRESQAARGLALQIRKELGDRTYTFMEVCGSHTMAIYRYGIKSLLPENLHLLSGPGCPVCVTPNAYLDQAIAYARLDDVIITTFGDMMRVPGSTSSLEKERAAGRDIRVVYSTLDALQIARQNPDKQVIFLAIGFETTAPTTAASVLTAASENMDNFFLLCSHKVMPPPMKVLAEAEDLRLDGFICPAHVSTIIGASLYEFLAREYHIPCVIAGFEPLDILQGIWMLIRQCNEGRAEVEIEYHRVARPQGNPVARRIMEHVFAPVDAEWRGLGIIPDSGLKLAPEYAAFDVERQRPVEVEPTRVNKGCLCGQILRGVARPPDCKLYGTICTPENPAGACMVSSEGTCAAYYRYVGLNDEV